MKKDGNEIRKEYFPFVRACFWSRATAERRLAR